jgi:2-keto-4-pentenoate hydratase/2-oxohepta-3-ene-1,7-dioic acid hydratase in catechol pathway
MPKEPTLFLKATSALCGPTDDLVMPREATSVDWEVELGVVIGKPGVYIAEREALDHVLGYCIGIDFSERDFQFNRAGRASRARVPTPSRRSDHFSRRATRSPIPKSCRCV